MTKAIHDLLSPDAVMLAELVVNHRVGQGVLPDEALAVHVREVVPLGESLQGALPRHLGREFALRVVAVGLVVPQRQFGTKSPRCASRSMVAPAISTAQMKPCRSSEGSSTRP